MKITKTEKKTIFNTIKKKIKKNSSDKIDKKELLGYLLSKYNKSTVRYVIEELIKLQRLSFYEDKAEIYRLRDKTTSSQLKPLTFNTQKIYLVIENSETKGMWIQTIVKNQHIPYRIVYKSIKTLEKLGLIKRSNDTNRKKYLSIMYFKEEKKSFEKTFFRKISSFTKNYFIKRVVQSTTLVELYNLLNEKDKIIFSINDGIEKNIKTLVLSLMCEDKVLPFPSVSVKEEIRHKSDVDLFLNILSERTKLCINTRPVNSNFALMPCCSCDLKDVCYKGNGVNPEECDYLSSWLDGF